MKYNIFAYILALGLCISPFDGERTVWYVHPDSSLNSIQSALDSCSANDIVLVAPGTYVGAIRWPNTQGIKLVSEQGYERTIIDADSAGSGIMIAAAVDTTTLIRGFTIRNGFAGTSWPGWGGAICCSTQSASPTIAENKLTNCTAYIGGAIHVWGSSPIIKKNIISNNTAVSSSGAIYMIDSQGKVIDNIIELNSTPSNSATLVQDCQFSTVRNNVIRHNFGNGLMIGGYSIHIDSCSIYGNTGDGIRDNGGSVIRHCNICSNGGYGVANISGGTDTTDAEDNWWGDATGPWNPTHNPGGLGDEVSDYVDFLPWLDHPVAVEESPATQPRRPRRMGYAVVFAGALPPSLRDLGTIYNCSGRRTAPEDMKPGVYYLDIEGKERIKIVKVK